MKALPDMIAVDAMQTFCSIGCQIGCIQSAGMSFRIYTAME